MVNQIRSNQSGQFSCQPKALYIPLNVRQLAQELDEIRNRQLSLRVIGSGLSPSDIAMSDGALICMDHCNHIKKIDVNEQTITVQPGVTLAQMNNALALHGMALPVQGSIANQTVAGAIATATHGTGINFGTLSSLVVAATLMTVDGNTIDINHIENTDYLKGVACHLGSLGIITELTLKVVEAFDLEVNEKANTLDGILEVLGKRLEYDYFRFWYIPHTDCVWEWQATACKPGRVKQSLNTLERAKRWYREKLIDYHALQALLYAGTRMPKIIPSVNRWYVKRRFLKPKASRADSVTQFTFDCLFRQYVNEWSIPVYKTELALKKLRNLINDKGYKVHLPIEVRFVKGDDLWLSPSQGRDSCYIGIIAYHPYGKQSEYKAYFSDFENIMLGLGGRPHWGKHFVTDITKISSAYPYWENYQALRRKLDPDYRLRNAFTERVLDVKHC